MILLCSAARIAQSLISNYEHSDTHARKLRHNQVEKPRPTSIVMQIKLHGHSSTPLEPDVLNFFWRTYLHFQRNYIRSVYRPLFTLIA